MVEYGRRCHHLPVHSAVAEYRESLATQPEMVFIASRSLKEQEGFCTLQNSLERTLVH